MGIPRLPPQLSSAAAPFTDQSSLLDWATRKFVVPPKLVAGSRALGRANQLQHEYDGLIGALKARLRDSIHSKEGLATSSLLRQSRSDELNLPLVHFDEYVWLAFIATWERIVQQGRAAQEATMRDEDKHGDTQEQALAAASSSPAAVAASAAGTVSDPALAMAPAMESADARSGVTVGAGAAAPASSEAASSAPTIARPPCFCGAHAECGKDDDADDADDQSADDQDEVRSTIDECVAAALPHQSADAVLSRPASAEVDLSGMTTF